MIRKAIALAAFLTATLCFAQSRGRVVTVPEAGAVPGTTVGGLVTGVSGSIVSLAGGLVTLDVSAAKILGENGVAGNLSSITPGSIVFAVLKSAESAPNAPLPAMSIAVMRSAQVTLPVFSAEISFPVSRSVT